MESAVEEHKLHFNLVHEPDGGRVGYQKVCKKEDKPVDDDEIVKAFEIRKGKWVYLEDEDFKGAALDNAQKTIDIRAFVEQEEIDPIFFERTYYLTPKDGGEKVYALLARAMEESGLVAVATFVMRDRQHLALPARPRQGDHARADALRRRDPARRRGSRPRACGWTRRSSRWRASSSSSSRAPSSPRSSPTRTATPWSRSSRRRRRARPSTVAEEEQPEAPVDLMAALRESVGAAKKNRSKTRRPRKAKRKAA